VVDVVLRSSLGCSDPASILSGVRLPPDTEIIKYTSSMAGPKIPGNTNRGRKKTISLDPPSVSVTATHSSTGLLIDRNRRNDRARPKVSAKALPSHATKTIQRNGIFYLRNHVPRENILIDILYYS